MSFFGRKSAPDQVPENQAVPPASTLSLEESQKTLQQVKDEGMSATNLKKIAESLSKTSGDAQARLARIAESLRGPKPVAAPGKRAEQPASGGFYGPLSEATSHLVDVTNLIAEIEVVLGIREGDAIVGPNLNA